MKKKRRLYLLIIVLFFVFVLFGTTIIASKDFRKNKVENREATKGYPEEQTISCTKETKDGVTMTEEVYLQKGVLITRTNIHEWYQTTSGEVACKHYTNKAAGLNGKRGVTSTTNCSSTSGSNTTTYTISEIDREDIKLKQFEYMDSENIFNYAAWKQYMEKDGYVCKIN